MDFIEKRLLTSRKKLVLLQFILEGYEGLVSISTLDARSGEVGLTMAPECLQDLLPVLEALKRDIGFRWKPG